MSNLAWKLNIKHATHDDEHTQVDKSFWQSVIHHIKHELNAWKFFITVVTLGFTTDALKMLAIIEVNKKKYNLPKNSQSASNFSVGFLR